MGYGKTKSAGSMRPTTSTGQERYCRSSIRVGKGLPAGFPATGLVQRPLFPNSLAGCQVPFVLPRSSRREGGRCLTDRQVMTGDSRVLQYHVTVRCSPQDPAVFLPTYCHRLYSRFAVYPRTAFPHAPQTLPRGLAAVGTFPMVHLFGIRLCPRALDDRTA